MSTAIVWFRRDFRIADNSALNAAAASYDSLVPVYIPSHWKKHHHWCGAPRQEFLIGCLESLCKNLENKGGRLLIRDGDPVAALELLARDSSADAIFFNRDPDPFGRAMEARVEQRLSSLGLKVFPCKDVAVHERDEVLTSSGTPFRVFTPYSRAWAKLEHPQPGKTLSRIHVPKDLKSLPLPTLSHWGLSASNSDFPTPGEAAARKRLARFLDGPILDYASRRDLPACGGTSRLSQDLRFGTLSIREVLDKARDAEKAARSRDHRHSVATFINELVWREFYLQVLWHHPDVLKHEFVPEYRSLSWRAYWRPENDASWSRDHSARDDFQRWCSGTTGFPIVDAGMRQLAATGFMHNRVRMIVAMFLTKDLRIWWMHGESWFMRLLIDGEIASNNGGWQWSASTGTDAAPYFRIQNPWSQTKRFDPDGAYIKKWIPELRDVAPKSFFGPPESPLADDYPLPIVDHATARDKALEMFRE